MRSDQALGVAILLLLLGALALTAGTVPYGIVDKARGYSADFAPVTGPATITIPQADLGTITRVVISAKDPYRFGWITLYDGKAQSTHPVNYAGTPLLLELSWSGSLADGHGTIAWESKPTAVGGRLGALLTGRTYQVKTWYEGREYPSEWALQVTGTAVMGTSGWSCCPGPRTDPLANGRIEGDRFIIERNCTGQGTDVPCLQVYEGTLKGQVIEGSFTMNGKPAGTWALYL
jgi:hypothetical protein